VLSLLPERLDRMLLLGAHCDDIAIGAGGALLELCRSHPGIAVTALVLTGTGTAGAYHAGILRALYEGKLDLKKAQAAANKALGKE